jgi:hypothetical protein
MQPEAEVRRYVGEAESLVFAAKPYTGRRLIEILRTALAKRLKPVS